MRTDDLTVEARRTRRPDGAAIYLLLQGAGGLAWWTMLFARPALRRCFLPSGSPDVALLAFGAGDGALFIGLSFVCAWGRIRRRSWSWPLLCAHAGAAMYAALYCLMLTLLTRGQAAWGAVLMLPALIVPPYLAWKLRPGEPS